VLPLVRLRRKLLEKFPTKPSDSLRNIVVNELGGRFVGVEFLDILS
jgi:hypothetical protein